MTTGTKSGSPTLSFGVGAPVAIAPENSRYFDVTNAALYVEYIIKGGTWVAISGTSQTLAPSTFANPPAANVSQGVRGLVTDGNRTATGNFNAASAGGGTFVQPVFSDGTSWLIG